MDPFFPQKLTCENTDPNQVIAINAVKDYLDKKQMIGHKNKMKTKLDRFIIDFYDLWLNCLGKQKSERRMEGRADGLCVNEHEQKTKWDVLHIRKKYCETICIIDMNIDKQSIEK